MASIVLSVIILLFTLGSIENQINTANPTNVAARNWLLDKDRSYNQWLPNIQDIEFEHLPLKNKEDSSSCQSKAITSFACSGSCTSYVQMSTSKFWQHERSCSCCQQTGLQEATFTLDCPSLDPPYKRVKTYAPVDCICRACTDLGKENLQPQELVEALAEQRIDMDKI